MTTEGMPARHLDALGTFHRLREAYFRYYDTPFGLADQRLQQERRSLLDRDGGAYRQPLLELRPDYTGSGQTLATSAAGAGAPAELADFASCGLIPPGRSLYRHQEVALGAAQQGRNMAITAGTGSGKTESFLLPVLARLLDESRSWRGAPAPAASTPWWQTGAAFQEQRAGETGHPHAVRALVLYPMNALVDDQLTRLRRALDSGAAREWLDRHRGGHRFYFGRYTGATPVTGRPSNNLAVDNLRDYLQHTARRYARARVLSVAPGQEDTQYFVPRLDGAEMRSRWDMHGAPPDILITNYSMLNVMLLRERDSRFFDSTRRWLDSDPDHVFTLVVDELHMYRGTAGTEVAYLLRALQHRLGLDSRQGQLRILAASASLDPLRDARYLQDFFGVDQDSFIFVTGSTRGADGAEPGTAGDASELAAAPPEQAASLARDRGITSALRNAFHDQGRDGAPASARTVAALAGRVFPGAGQTGQAALERLLEGLAASPADGDPRLRTHLFFRNIPGIWACTDPQCPDIPGGSYPNRGVGRLYAEPATRCTCGARVLEALYCQNCGDVLLGGFSPEGAAQRGSFDDILLADVPDLAKLPDQVVLERTAANYVVYWPQPVTRLSELDSEDWTRDRGAVRFAFRRSHLNPGTGELRNTGQGHTGWSFHGASARSRTGEPRHPLPTLSPYPTQCPACGDDWEIKYGPDGALPFTDPLRRRSPIRTMRTGFEKINQVLTTELASDLDAGDRKVIVFTDSRQDAAKLSAGLALRHYQDLLRLLLYRQLQRREDPGADVALARTHHTSRQRTPQSWAAIERLKARDRVTYDRLSDVWDGAPGADPATEETLIRRLARDLTVTELSSQLADELLRLGMNPGGPHARLQHTIDGAVGWSTLYDWAVAPPRPRPGLSQQQHLLLADIGDQLDREILDGLFSGVGRDFESLGLGWLALDDDQDPAQLPPGSPTGYARAALRVLADQRRFDRLRDPRPSATPRLNALWAEIERSGGPPAAELSRLLDNRAGDAVRGYVINPGRVVLRRASGPAWLCSSCRRKHLTAGCGLCTKCRRPLPEAPTSIEPDTDYYAWKAASDTGRFRLHCAELTGQTDRLDAQSRQSRFQGVFLGGTEENPLADGIDLLSVTTTMEAGVDIGALSAVVLGNMPPTRFNYQQRVGRAGRRDTPVAVALTVCRGRSHDEYYFDRPDAITNEPTPKPYLALDQDQIYRRALASEILRAAMTDLGPQLEQNGTDLTVNVHGAYGRPADWPQIRGELAGWLDSHRGTVEACAKALAAYTPRQHTAAQAADQCGSQLVELIDAAAGGTGHHELSQRLAERGVLPMYGFPTGVRYLYLNRPFRAYPWPPAGVIDRDLAMAVSQFSPLSEIVRDGQVFPVVGVAAFQPAGRTTRPEPEPLGPQRYVTTCRVCSYLADQEHPPAGDFSALPCPRCGAAPGSYRTMPLREPLGFRSGPPRDFDGNFAFNPRTVAARALANLDDLTAAHTDSYVAHSGPGSRYVINDNSGDLFTFRRASASRGSWGGYVATAAIDQGLLRQGDAAGDPVSVALGAVQPTDFLFIGPTQPVIPTAGIRLNLGAGETQPCGARESIDGRRGAWYSLAFLLRRVAAAYLDIQPQELAAGIYSGMSGPEPALHAFIADTTDNGAGFSTHLGSPSVLPDLLHHAQQFLDQLGEPGHAQRCSASCYRCLRDYANMGYHALLDWRLSRDLFAALTTKEFPADPEWQQRSVQQWAHGLNADVLPNLPAAAAVFTHRGDKVLLVVRHTLEASETSMRAPRLAAAARQATTQDPAIRGTVYADPFTLDRDPRKPLEMWEQSNNNLA